MKGIILAGGIGSRLYPLTICTNKQLLPVYDKPMIYYPLSTLINFGINEICIITSSNHISSYKKLFKNSSDLGLNIIYKIQKKPNGIAEALLIAEDFINEENVCLILGDNIFHGISKPKIQKNGATIFAYKVSDPTPFGVVEFNKNNLAISIEEKPTNPKSNFAVPGLYFYDKNAVKYTKTLKPSKRGELEITDLNRIYLDEKKLNVIKFPKRSVYLDAGTPENLLQSGSYVEAIQKTQGIKIACIEEDCYKKGFMSKSNLEKIINKTPKSQHRNYLLNLL